MKHTRHSTLGIALAALAGCAAVYEGKYDFSDGWREAEVMLVTSAGEITKPQFSDCRESVSRDQQSKLRFALLSYQSSGRKRVHVAPLKPDQNFREADLVYVNVRQCGLPVVLRTP